MYVKHSTDLHSYSQISKFRDVWNICGIIIELPGTRGNHICKVLRKMLIRLRQQTDGMQALPPSPHAVHLLSSCHHLLYGTYGTVGVRHV